MCDIFDKTNTRSILALISLRFVRIKGYMITKNMSVRIARSTKKLPPVSLSDFYPKGTIYFYGYPSGTDSGFLNLDPPSSEELIAARPNICLGANMSVINFCASSEERISQDVLMALQLQQPAQTQIRTLPSTITHDVLGIQRNEAVQAFLHNTVPSGMLAMAQPYVDESFRALCRIDPHLTSWLNDKAHMTHYIAPDTLPAQYGLYTSGAELVQCIADIPVPCVVKLTSSGGGDGVYICKSATALASAATKLARIEGTIYVEQYIQTVRNYGVQFGVPHDDGDIKILGISEQIVSESGEFLGGIVSKNQTKAYRQLEHILHMMLQDTLPFVKNLGWHGVGCLDVLTDREGKAYIIDANFRMTGMTAAHFLNCNNAIQRHALVLTADFCGNKQQLMQALVPFVNSGQLRVIALTRTKNNWKINACVQYGSITERRLVARSLIGNNLTSKTLHMYAE